MPPLERVALDSVVICSAGFIGNVLGQALASVSRVARTTCFGTGASTLDALAARPATLAIVDQHPVDVDGLDLIERISALGYARRCLLIADSLTEWSCLRLASETTDSYFDFSVDPLERLPTAVLHLLDGGGYRSSTLREARRRAVQDRTPLDLVLSPTEMIVFSAMADGADDDTVGTRLGMARLTVQSHRQRIMKKLSLRTRVELVFEAQRRGLSRPGARGVIRAGCPSAYAARSRRGRPAVTAGAFTNST